MIMMRFDIMRIIFMMVAIWLGTLVGAMVTGMIGFGGGIIGTIIVGFIIYAIYSLITGSKIKLMNGAIFAAIVWIAQMLAGIIGGFTGLAGGIIGLFFTAVLSSLLWSWVGTDEGKAPVAT